jgi:hypothetical protein
MRLMIRGHLADTLERDAHTEAVSAWDRFYVGVSAPSTYLLRTTNYGREAVIWLYGGGSRRFTFDSL